MAVNGSFTATLSPTISESFSNPLLPAASRHSSSSISKTYRQASTLFLTRRLPESLSTIRPLVTPPVKEDSTVATDPAPVATASRTTRIKVWSLYLTILNAIVDLEPDEGKDAFGTQEWRAICANVRDGDVWEDVVQNGYHGIEGNVDSDVVINLATILLAHARTQTLNQKRLESYLAASQTPNLDLSNKFHTPSSPRQRYRSPAKSTSGAETPRDLNARVKILELYTLHVLLRNNEWDYAREFISVSSVLDEERREAFLQALQSLQEEQKLAEKREQEEKQKQEEQVRKDVEESRRLRAENEEREKKRIEEERAKREGSEVDYGIETTPSVGGSAKGRHSRAPSSLARAPVSAQPSTPKTRAKGKTVGPPSLSARAGTIMSNFRALLEQMGASMQANPMILTRLLFFIIGLVLMFGRKDIRERIFRILGNSWNKILATAGMGVKVSYI